MVAEVSSERIIRSRAPLRVCDLGGWTDTWFAGRGRVLNIAVTPAVEVCVRASRGAGAEQRLCGRAETSHQSHMHNAGAELSIHNPLVRATIQMMEIPESLRLEITTCCDVPSGSSMGTSAALCVALVGALDRLRSGRMGTTEIMRAAHRVETECLSQESGIQDQVAAVYGGVNYIEMDEYPQARVTKVRLPDAQLRELEGRLVLVFVGRAHCSSAVHETVIKRLGSTGSDNPQLSRLRRLAAEGRDALFGGDLARFGQVMTENTEAQAELHAMLVGERHRRIIQAARRYGAAGWKVNGAGGEGGSVTILRRSIDEAPHELFGALQACCDGVRVIPLTISHTGQRSWELPARCP